MHIRNLQGIWKLIFRYTAIIFSLFYLYSAGIGLVSTEMHRGLYLLFNLVLAFMLYPVIRKRGGGEKVPIYDLLLIVLAILTFGYWILEYKNYVTRVMMTNNWDFWFGIIAIILLFEITRRVLGNVLLIIGLAFFIQLYFGSYLPGNLAHAGFSLKRIVEFNYSSMEGIFGVITHTFATYVLPFIILGAFFEKSGAGEFFIKLAVSLTKGWAGGPAKVAVIASGIFGSISGSSVANVVSTGAFTIPMMKRVGFKPHVAGAIEAAASTGGQFLPPIMGAGAFLLATFTETPYIQIAMMNLIPALLYFYWVGCAIHFEALKYNIKGLPENEIPDFWLTLKSGWFFFAPLVLIVVILIGGYSPALAGFWAIITTIVLSWLKKDSRMGLKDIFDALETGGKNNLSVGASIGMLGIIMGGIVLAGLGAKFSSLVVSLSGGILLISIALVAVVGAIIGMGATQTATYLIVAMITVPGLIALGVDKVTAHIIAFWFSAISNVTPPVCVSAFAAASIAGSDPMKTGFTGVKYSLLLFIIPFTFVYFPEILLQGSLGMIIYVTCSFVIAIPVIAAGIQGFFLNNLSIVQRIVMIVAGIAMFVPSVWTDLIGILVVTVIYVMQKKEKNKKSIIISQ